jgi:hypothetical protein
MRHGWFPINDNIVDYGYQQMDNTNQPMIKSEYSASVSAGLFRQIVDWRAASMQKIKKEALDEASSGKLLFLAPELVYSGSKRPVTDMSLFRTANSLKLSDQSSLKGWQLIPVTRYAKGMSRGLYYQRDDCEGTCSYCGTFYYHEPQSTTFLAYKNSLTFLNKYQAYYSLIKKWPNITMVPKSMRPGGQKILEDFLASRLPLDLLMTYRELTEYMETLDPETRSKLEQPANPDDDQRYYVGKFLGLYALEDVFDQVLCNLGVLEGVDIIHLTNMVGSRQVVHEVLDVRDRTESFRSLVYQ